MRICHGCIDKEAGQYVVNLNLDSVEQVIDKIKSFQFNHQSIYDKPKKELQNTDKPLIMRQLKSKSSIMIPIRVQGITVDGITDTASDVTIISDKVYNSLPVKPSMPCILLVEICL